MKRRTLALCVALGISCSVSAQEVQTITIGESLGEFEVVAPQPLGVRCCWLALFACLLLLLLCCCVAVLLCCCVAVLLWPCR